MRIGLLVNPIAGVGGPAGLKGSDGAWQEALARGVEPQAQTRARELVQGLADVEIQWISAPGCMGVPEAEQLDLEVPDLGSTTPADTHRVTKALLAAGIDLLVFVGGDGTATDLVGVVPDDQPVLGIPGGVKITSPVFAFTVEDAIDMLELLRPGFESEMRDVTDLDEERYQHNEVQVVLKGSLRVPLSPLIQGGKCATPQESRLEPLVEQVMNHWPGEDALVLVGAGSVMRAIKQQFWGTPTLLGIDAIHKGKIVATDLSGERLDELMAQHDDVHLMISPIGGQGMVLGRGTQQLRPHHLEQIGWDNIHVVSPPEKLLGVKAVRFDTGSKTLDATAPKFVRITVGYNETRLMRTA